MDTIAAVATPVGRGGIGIIRVSGPLTPKIAATVTGQTPTARNVLYRRFLDAAGEAIDEGIVIFFEAPHSYTGEDVCEFHCHGSPVVLDMLLCRIIELGARLAEPGEYTRRAFENDRLDLAQAEAVADLIASTTQASARSAMRSLKGEFSNVIQQLGEQLLAVRVYIEAAIDFPEEEIDFLAESDVEQRVDSIFQSMRKLVDQSERGQLLRDGLRVVIAGMPNAGKSSLLNYLAGEDRAIVTETAGTTRDFIEVSLIIDDLLVILTDTAGLRATQDPIESEGVRRTWNVLGDSDIILYLVDRAAGVAAEDVKFLQQMDTESVVLVWNKTDLPGRETSDVLPENLVQVAISAKTGDGIANLKQKIRERSGYEYSEKSVFLARRRHLEALKRATGHVEAALVALRERRAGELAAQDLRDAHAALGEIIGEVSSDELLGEIFSSFCIGK